VVQVVTENGEPDALLTRTLVNSIQPSGPFILNSILSCMNSPQLLLPIYYANGSYASYLGPGVSNARHLIYPVPEVGTKAHCFAGLGTHLALNLSGSIHFGRDIEWIAPPGGASPRKMRAPSTFGPHISYLRKHRYPFYLPNIALEGLRPDYCGIRPNLPHRFMDSTTFKYVRTGYMGAERVGG